MSLFMNQNGNRTELQERIAKDLQDKARRKAAEGDRPDGVEDSAFVKNTEKTSWTAGLWITVSIIAVIGFIILVIVASF
jgi:hypothetical protein